MYLIIKNGDMKKPIMARFIDGMVFDRKDHVQIHGDRRRGKVFEKAKDVNHPPIVEANLRGISGKRISK